MVIILLSVIIITLNEAENVQKSIESARRAATFPSGRSIHLEVIVSDGGSIDNTIEIAERYADMVIKSPRGRYKQLNEGARVAKGDILLFLHADTLLPEYALLKLRHIMNGLTVIGGGFVKKWKWSSHIKRSKFLDFIFFFWEGFDNWIIWLLKTFPGDNAIFVRRNAFEDLNGYAPLWICEDFDFIRRLKIYCKKKSNNIEKRRKRHKRSLVCINNKVMTSTRRFEKYGFFRTVRVWFGIYIFWRLGMPTEQIRVRYKKYSTEPEKANQKFLRF